LVYSRGGWAGRSTGRGEVVVMEEVSAMVMFDIVRMVMER
jgi:hypothetical protein